VYGVLSCQGVFLARVSKGKGAVGILGGAEEEGADDW